MVTIPFMQSQTSLEKVIFDFSLENIAILDKELTILKASKNLIAFLEITESDLGKIRLSEMIDQENKAAVQNILADHSSQKNGTSILFRTNIINRSKSLYFCEIKSTLYTEETDGKSYQIIFIDDITAREREQNIKRAINEIAQVATKVSKLKPLYSEVHKIVSTLLDARNFYIALYHQETEQVSFPYYVDELETPEGPIEFPPEAMGKSLTEYIITKSEPLLIYEDGFEKLEQAGEVILIGAPSKEWLGVPLKTSTGNTIGVVAVQTYSDEVHYDNRDLEVLSFVSTQIAMAIERTQAEEKRRESEQLFRTLTDSSLTAIFMISNDRFQFFNPACERLLGYDKAGLKEINISSIVHLDHLQEVSEGFRQLITDEIKKFDRQLMINTRQGEERWINLSTVAVDLPGERAILGNAYDITEQIQTYNTLKDTLNKAEEANRFKTTLMANLSHEFRTPMNGILGFTGLLLEEIEDEDQSDMLQRILGSGNRLMASLNAILLLSRLQSIGKNFKRVPIDLLSMVDSLVNDLKPEAEKKNLNFSIESTLTTARLASEEEMMKQLFYNVIQNAIKYTPAGSVTVSISSECRDAKKYIRVSIKDTGIGIAAEKQRTIFEAFRQSSEGLSRTYEGLGLGLTIVYQIVELNEGFLFLKSEEQKGSDFTILLPGTEVVDIAGNATETNGNGGNAGYTMMSTRSILLVEDNQINRDIVQLFLKDICKVDFAINADEALAMVKEKPYQIILMDINLGLGMNGIEAAKQIRTYDGYAETPIVAVTGYAQPSDKKNFLENGCTHYLAKPFSKKQLTELVQNLFEPKN